jgi:hypothetical protein
METKRSQSNLKSDEITLKDLFLKARFYYRFLLSKWILILIVGISGGLLGLVYAYVKKPVYFAATTFVLEDSGSGSAGMLGNLGGLASMVGIDVGGGGGIFQGDNILELYKSRNIIQKTLLTEIDFNGKKQLLVDRYIDFNDLKKSWSKTPKLTNINFSKSQPFTRLQDSILGTIVEDIKKEYLSVGKPDKKLSIISAEVRSRDEFFAMAFNREIVKNVNNFYVQTRTKKSLDNVNILQQKVDSVRAVMNGALYTAAAVADATPNLNPTRQLQRVAPVQRSQFSAETNKLILGELVKNLELSKISLRKETPLIQVLDEPVFPLIKEKAGKAKWLIIGGCLGGFLIVAFLIVKKIFQNLLL